VYIGLFEEATANGKLCLCGMLSAEIASLDSASRALLVAFFKLAESWLQSAFEQHADQLNVAIDPKPLAQALLAGLEGAILLDRVQGGQNHLKGQKLLMMGLIAR
jgi:TetR/AcrR family transcriptional regulator, transcriptional repressor for nem operon